MPAPQRSGRSGALAPSWDVANNSRLPAAPDVARRRDQIKARRWLWRESALHRVQSCGRVPCGQSVELGIRDGARAHWSGLVSCGSVHSCPVCSERIWAERADELRALLVAAHGAGYVVSMVTLTVRHTAGDGLSEQLDALNDAWSAAQNSSAVARCKREAGVVGMVRRLEITDGAHGWHPHLHALVIHSVPGRASVLGATIHRAFASRLTRHGVESWATRGGLDARELSLDAALEQIAGYVVKGSYRGPANEGAALAAAREVAAGRGKLGRRASRSHWENLDGAAGGDRALAARVAEYERATKGRRALTWTKGLRSMFAVPDERSDDEIAADTDSAQEAVALFSPRDWAALRRDDEALTDLLEVVESAHSTFRYEAVLAYLEARGFRFIPARPDDPLEVAA